MSRLLRRRKLREPLACRRPLQRGRSSALVEVEEAKRAAVMEDVVQDERDQAAHEQGDDQVAEPVRRRVDPLVAERQEDGDHHEDADAVANDHRRQQIVPDLRGDLALVGLEVACRVSPARPKRDEREQTDDGETGEARRQRPRQPRLALSVHARAETTSIACTLALCDASYRGSDPVRVRRHCRSGRCAPPESRPSVATPARPPRRCRARCCPGRRRSRAGGPGRRQ